jgi:transcriptional regulator with XRE-family HTH domain
VQSPVQDIAETLDCATPPCQVRVNSNRPLLYSHRPERMSEMHMCEKPQFEGPVRPAARMRREEGGAAAVRGNRLGSSVRASRLARGLSVRALAGRLGMSSSAVSQIETGKVQPSVRTLRALAAELGMSVDEALFGRDEQHEDRAPTHADQNVSACEPGIAMQPAEQLRGITIDSGVRWELLTAWGDDTEFLEATFKPTGASDSDKTFAQHSGIEFGLVLSGILHVTLGFEEFVLNPGESITFASSTPHRMRNDGTEAVHAVWVVRGRRGAASDPGWRVRGERLRSTSVFQ